jgi:hypothetical protein
MSTIPTSASSTLLAAIWTIGAASILLTFMVMGCLWKRGGEEGRMKAAERSVRDIHILNYFNIKFIK